MNAKPAVWLLLLGLCSCAVAFSQSTPDFSCGFDALRTPLREQQIQSFEEQLSNYFFAKNNLGVASKGFTGFPYVVPVVVHIIHDGGPENISDALVLAAIDHLNQGFAAEGYFAQKGATVNTQIQFCLAKRDPDGNATTGITRTQSPLTNMIMETQDIQTKDLSRWKPTEYVNIWVVKEIDSQSYGSGVAGYAYFPSSHGRPEDGMICEARYFGKSHADDGVLIHEMGHYFGLYHTFEGGCKNDDCMVDGDRVCDTPPDKATHTSCPYNSCSTDVAPGSPFSSDVDDFTDDFMDYSPFSCMAIFTQGQALRMQGSVETVRKSLLNSKGCLDPCTQAITAAFTATPNPALAGQTVTFTNSSTGASGFSWSENGTEFSQIANPSRIFSTPGNYLIQLDVTNSDPNCGDQTSLVVQVVCPIEADFTVSAYEITPGQTVVFTNTSTGGATGYVWSINGLVQSTTANFSFTFINPGYYNVEMAANGPACSRAKTVLIHVLAPCGDQINVETQFADGQSFIYTSDMVGLPDGSLIQVGRTMGKPMMTRLDAVGNILWHKVVDAPGIFSDIEALPDGTFILWGHVNDKMLLAKLDDAGNFVWFKTLDNPQGNYYGEFGVKCLAVNPDGSVIFYCRGDNGYGGIGKVSPAGVVLWLRQLSTLDSTGGIQLAKDGTQDILVTGLYYLSGLEYVINRVDQNGNFVAGYRYDLPQVNNSGTNVPALSVHANGDFSMLFFVTYDPGFVMGDKYMIRCSADGQPLWAKKIASPGGAWSLLRARYWPDEGWLLSDYKNTSDSYIIRLNDAGDPLWQRKIGTGGFGGDEFSASIRQNGMIRGMKQIKGRKQLHLVQIPDAYTPLGCLPDIPLSEIVTTVQVTRAAVNPTIIGVNYMLNPEPYSFLPDAQLSRNVLCREAIPCPEFCENEQDDDGDGLVDCFDPDCPCFDADTACTVPQPANNFAAKEAWRSAVSDASVSSVPIIANLNPQLDSIPEIIVIPSSTAVSTVNTFKILIFKGDGSNAANPNVLNIPQGVEAYPAVHPTVADLDRNGIPEMVMVSTDGRIRVFTDFDPNANPCMRLWTVSAQPVFSGNTRAFVADFDGDGIGEIFSGNKVFRLDLTNPSFPALNLVVGGTGAQGQLGWSNFAQPAEGSTAADLLSRSDCNGDPDCDGLEIAAGYQIYSIDIDPADGDGYQIKVQRNLNILDANHAHTDGYTAVADLNLDGTPEIIVSGIRDNGRGLYVWNKNGLVHHFTGPAMNQIYGMVCVANVYDDRTAGFAQDFPELIACQANGLLCLNLQKGQSTPAQPYWWNLPTVDASGLTGPSVFDFNGDGRPEIVYRDEQNLRIMYGGPTPFPTGVDAQRNWFKTVAGSGTFDEYPVVADVDNDGQAEIAVTGYLFGGDNSPVADYRGRLRIFESAASPWLPARPIWNQYNYFVVNINDDLTAPKVQQKHWLEMGGIGSGKRPFNMHLSQVPSLNPTPLNKIKVPDARIAVESATCKTDSFEVVLNFCNEGSAPLPAGAPVAFYNNNPTTTAAALLFPPVALNVPLEKGQCQQVTLTIPATYNTLLYAVVNDNGSKPTPFNLGADFPSTNQPECKYDNNLVSFSVQNQTPPLDLGPDVTLCKNSVVALKANPAFQRYRWQDGSANADFTAFGPGKYWVDAFDGCGRRRTDTILVLLNTIDTLDLPDQIFLCAGDSIHLGSSGFSSYNWSPSDSLSCADCAAVDAWGNASFTIFLTAAKGECVVSDSVRVEVKSPPVVQLEVQNGDCHSIAGIIPHVTGDGPFDFEWSGVGVDSLLHPAQSGTYTVKIADQYGCQIVDSAAVEIASDLQVASMPSAPACASASTGGIDLTVSGGQAPFQFLWSNNAVTEDLSNAPAGTYSVIVSDANGCSAILSSTLNDPPAIQLSLPVTPPLCAGQSTGALDLTASGGTGGLTFLWSNNSTTEDLTQLPAGSYTVVATDANGCTAAVLATLTDPPALSLDLQATAPLCAGAATGAIDLTISGGTGGLQFAWSNQQTNEDPGALTAGTYSVVVTDANGCTATLSATLTDPPAIQGGLQKTDPLCAGAATGAIDLTASGGTGGLQFAWSNNSATEDIVQSAAGAYTVIVTDANGCTLALSATLTDPPAIQQSVQVIHPKCSGQADGVINLTAGGGAGGLQFLWSNNSSQEDIAGLGAGTYHLVTTDANGCTAALSATLTDPPAIVLNLQKTDPKCAGDANGAVDLNASGGTGGLQILWSNNSGTEDLSQVPAGTYSVTGTDANGCTAALSVVLSDPPAIVATVQPGVQHCPGDLVTIDIVASGGAPPLSYVWSNGAVTQDISTTQSGTFTVNISDANGCKKLETVSITPLGTAPVLQLAGNTLTCLQTSVVISASSSLANCSFSWSGTGAFSSGLSAPTVSIGGDYSVTVTEPAGGCTAVGTVTVATDTVSPVIQLAADVQEIPCDQSTITLSAAGSSSGPAYTAQWTAGAGGSIVSGANSLAPSVGSAGAYTLLITDTTNGCTASATVQVDQATPPTAEIAVDSVRCYGEQNGVISFVGASGGTPPFSYSIDQQHFQPEPVFEGLGAGQYQVEVQDALGCTYSTTVNVAQPGLLAVDLAGDTLVIAGEAAHVQAVVSPPGFIPAQISWSPGGLLPVQQQLEQSVALFESTLFEIRVEDGRGCFAVDSWLVKVDKGQNVYVPNVIYPDNPAGTNQVFLIFADAGVREIESLTVFDRWGDQVFLREHFSPNQESEGWNGTFRGKPVQVGVYVWLARVAFTDGSKQVLKGDVTVVR